jgi:hypothetical protein
MAQTPSGEPTELYNRAKRNLVIAVGLLAIVLLGLIDSKDTPEFFGIHLSPQAIPTTLFFITLYLLYQYWLAWSFQPDAIQKVIRHDFFVTIIPTIFVLLGYLFGYLVSQFVGLNYVPLAIGAGLAVAASAIALYLFQRVKLLSAEREKSELRQDTIQKRLLEPGWRLNFNPHFAQKIKPISFNDDGTIGDGRNVNESKWRWRDNVLEILREDGGVHNRFKYDPTTDRFVATQPSAVHGITGQFIYRDF